MQRFALLLCLFLLCYCNPQQKPGQELLEKTIDFHDPQDNWSKFKAHLYLSSTDTAGNENPFELEMDNATGYFAHITRKDGKEIVQGISGDKEFYLIDGKKEINEDDRTKYKLTREGVRGTQRFYGYLYGLPMKLRDKGAIISDTVSTETFNGKTYQTLKVTHEPGMGKEIWTFFFDPTTSAMEAYKFMFSPESDEGEYITLEETLTVSDIKIPKIRKWYFVKSNEFLGTDNLIKAEQLTSYRN